MNKAIILIGMAALLSACGVNPNDAKRSLEAQGMKDVKIGGYAFLGCGERDNFRSSFTAIGANGQPVSGVVCSGFLKGITVRFD